MTIAEAKSRIGIHDLWRHFGFDGEPKSSCRCPWRHDSKPSFSVSPGGDLWNDFATGEAGDSVDFLQRASGLSRSDACRKFIELAGGRIAPLPRPSRPEPKPVTRPRPELAEFRAGTPAELDALARLRGIGREGLEWASERGCLRFATLKGHPAWIVTDAERVNAQARRLDGRTWDHLDGSPKAWTARGSWAGWPIGIKEAEPHACVALCEGGPDFLAGHYIALSEQASAHGRRDVQCAAVAMLGASLSIHEDSVPLFAGKRIRIFGHADEAGRQAAERWARQLEPVAEVVDAFSFAGLQRADGTPAKDLNDCLNLTADSFSQTRNLFPC